MSPTQRFIVQVGIIGALFAYLVVWMTSSASAQMKQTNDLLSQHVAATADLSQRLDRQTQTERAIVRIMQQTCINAGKTNADRAACLDLVGGQ